ncbi:hypothetical protein [Haloterrigena salifodinae]|uniref:Uncharacterized protein n=1 Tax=Haloterrigena salifodinae TaxID=2675099 RepID=A0A8T8E7I4_9EURY|nr:hypothetical protein [Haloterrigena salifodinae]QRV17627.1 hypothetical protein JMJ58_21850 [Haloterrigena salifodinae]
MPDDNRFAGLSDAVEDDPDEESDAESAAAESSSEESHSPTAEDDASVSDSETGGDSSGSESDSSAETAESDADGDTADNANTDDPTAFPFDATEKKTVYVRPETLADLDDARALIDAQLRTDHDVRDLTGREFYDAVFRLAAADTEGVIDEILEAREE